MNGNLLLLATLLWLPLLLRAQPVPTYRNPVIPGDFPDPTVIRVGDTYYAAGTTSDFAPHYPLYQSSDLINWERIGSVFQEHPAWTSGSFWAPELFYHDSTFYVFYTAKRKGDQESCIGVATTRNLADGFQDQGILIEWGNEAIDAYVYEDTDSTVYITWKAYGLDPDRPIEILGSALDLETMKLTGEPFSLTRHDQGWQGNGDEGQCLVRRGDYYYMFYSTGGCCDNRCDYEVHVSRSKALQRGWEQYPDPMMQGGGAWVCTGHGTLVQTPEERYYYLYHAYQADDFEYIGRQGMLDEVVWGDDGWPYFKYGPIPSLQAPVPREGTQQHRNTTFMDQFTTPDSLKFWQWDMTIPKPTMKVEGNQLVLTHTEAAAAFLGVSPQAGHYSIETKVGNPAPQAQGLSIYGDRAHYLSFLVQNNRLVIQQMKEGVVATLMEQPISFDGPVYLKAESINGRLYQFMWSQNGHDWQVMNEATPWVDGAYLPRWGTALRAGLMVGPGTGSSGAFTYFRMQHHL